MTQDLPKSHACQVSEQLRCGDCKKPQTLCQSMFALSKDTTVQKSTVVNVDVYQQTCLLMLVKKDCGVVLSNPLLPLQLKAMYIR